MSASQSIEEVPEYERYGPFGYHGNDVGTFAISMLEELLESKQVTRPRNSAAVAWDKGDRRAFNSFQELDTGIKFIEPAREVDGSDLGDLHRTFGRLHAALPFTEPERAWLWGANGRDAPEGLVGEAAEIMAGGVLRVVQGRDLVRRWWAWRRETDEFAGQGSLDEARQTLGMLAETLVTEPNWPREYPDIRARLQATHEG